MPLSLPLHPWDYVAFLPYVLQLQTEKGNKKRDAAAPGSRACLVWARCLRASVALLGLENAHPEGVGDDVLCEVVCDAFEDYIEEQQASERAFQRLCCESQRSLFLRSVTPEVLLDDATFSVAALCFCGGWLLVDGGPRCRRDAKLLLSALALREDGDDEGLDFLAHIDGDLFRSNPQIVSTFPYIVRFLPDELRREAAFVKALAALDYHLLEFADASLLQDRDVVAAAVGNAAARRCEDGDLLRSAREALETRGTNARMRRLTVDLACRLFGGCWKETLASAQRMVNYANRGRQEMNSVPIRATKAEEAVVQDLHRPPQCALPQRSCASLVEEEIRRANEEARLAKQQLGVLRRRPQRKRCGRRETEDKTHDVEALPAEAHKTKSACASRLLIISSHALDFEGATASSVKSGKVLRKEIKRRKLREARAEERRKVAELFGMG